MEFLIDTLKICNGDLFTKDDLIEGANEKDIEVASVEDGHSNNTSNKLEAGEMVGIDVGRWVNLEGVAIHSRIGE